VRHPTPEQLKPGRLWRYMTVEKFEWLMSERKLWMARLDTLHSKDKWEGFPSPAQTAKYLENARRDVRAGLGAYSSDREAFEGFVHFIREFQRRVYVNCWIQKEYECVSMWGNYGTGPESVAIQTTMGALASSLPSEMELLPIRYDQPTTSFVNDEYALVTQKRPAFAYENEVRVILHDRAGNGPEGIGLDWDPAAHLHGVFVHYDASKECFDRVQGILQQTAPALVETVRRSELAQSPLEMFLEELGRVCSPSAFVTPPP
jgi:hypothetical protein